MADCGVSVDRSSGEAIALCRGWIKDCENAHPNCAVSRKAGLPRRVLDCRTDRSIRLCKVSRVPAACRYIALSYCWGGTSPPMTERANVSKRFKSISWESMPKLYKDAIVLARNLDIPFLWIDSLCIIEDRKGDRDHEISQMGGIFESATVVIIAAASKSPCYGFAQDISKAWRADNRLRFIWRDLTTVHYGDVKLHGVKFREQVHNINYEVDACRQECISARAWTYQERQLARRCLIMKGKEMVWECKTTCLCECSGDQSSLALQKRLCPQLLPPICARADRKRQIFEKPSAAYHFWHDAVRMYTSRTLSRDGDRLPAISAIASLVSDATGDTYLAGLWRRDLIGGLMWYNNPSYEEVHPYTSYIAPSWSWASTPAPTRYPGVPSSPCAEVVEAWCKTDGDNSFGPVRDGAIVLNAVHCLAHVAIFRSPDNNWPMIRILMEGASTHETESHHSEFNFLDGFRVEAVSVSSNIDTRSQFLQRIRNPTGAMQYPCSGYVRLLWLAEDVCLILAYPKDGSEAFTRLGILDSRDQAPRIPTLHPSRIRII